MKYHLKKEKNKSHKHIVEDQNIQKEECVDMKPSYLQDMFLNQARKDERPVTLFLMNGYQMRGLISAFDSFVVILTSEGKQQVVYKHAISTITPEKPIPLEWEN